jgi:hypothetical protein
MTQMEDLGMLLQTEHPYPKHPRKKKKHHTDDSRDICDALTLTFGCHFLLGLSTHPYPSPTYANKYHIVKLLSNADGSSFPPDRYQSVLESGY